MEQNNSIKKSFMSKKTIFFIFILVLGFAIGIKNFVEKPIITEDSIGRILIEGPLLDTNNLLKKLEILEFNSKLKGLIVEIDSPGGAIVPSYQLYEKLKKISQKKPLVVVMKSVAASGGYLISLAGERIFAHPSTITGSIGVIFFKADFRELMNKVGVQPLIFKSGKLKASPNFIEGVDQDSNQMMERIIFNTKKQFLDLVIERRKIDNKEIVKDIENSGIYLGSEAKAIGLVDDLGDVENAYDWIINEKKLNFPLKEIDIKDKNKNSWIRKILESSIAINNMNFDFMNKNFILNRENGLYLMYDY